MALFNYATKEITLKIVYYGPGLSGKTTNLQYLHSVLDPEKTGKLLSLATETDRTLFFDFLPVELGKIRDFAVRFQLYTVPGQIKYNATRKIVLKGADAVVFVADSQKEVRDANIESFINMRENLLSNNINPDDIPIVLQYNKRDLANALPISELNNDINASDMVYIEAEAITGKGVQETFQTITRLLIRDISKKHKIEIPTTAPAAESVSAAPEPVEEIQIEEEIPVEGKISIEEEVPIEEIMEDIEGVKIIDAAETEESVPISQEEFGFEEALIGEEPIFSFQEPEIEVENAPTEAPAPPQFLKEEGKMEGDIGKPVIEESPSFQLEKFDEAVEKLKDAAHLPADIADKEENKFQKRIRKENAPAFPAEQLDRITENLRETTELLAGINASIKEFSVDLKKTKEDQKEILSIVRELKISEAVERIKSRGKSRKRWFGL